MTEIAPKMAAAVAKELNAPQTGHLDVDRLLLTRAALDVCSMHEQACTGSNQQYSSRDACMSVILNKPLGPWHQVSGCSNI